ncbi:cation-transporting P-type ATPase [Vibrio sp. M60_M31a]
MAPQEASQRLAKFGANKLPTSHGRSIFQRLLGQFNNVLIRVLLVVMVVTAAARSLGGCSSNRRRSDH